MSFSFDSDTKERVRAATDIVDLIGSRLELRRQGRNYVALCPWHSDTRPSLQVNTERQIWKCWVCDIGGDVFNFVMQEEGLSFPEALRKLAERAGIELKSGPGGRKGQRGRHDEKAELHRVLAWAEKLYQRCLRETEEGRRATEYLLQRGINQESIDRFGIGFAPDSWSFLADRSEAEKFSLRALDAAGLVKRRQSGSGYYDRFRKRIMFPIRDRESRVIGFGGRITPGSDDGAKYINSPETRLFQKSQQLYGFDVALDTIRRSKQAVIMEGYTDVIAAHQSGLTGSVAVLGTALGEPHLKLLQRHNCETVVLLLDGDEAGQKRSDDVLELFMHAQLDVRILTLPDGMDPADYLQQYGLEDLQQLISTAGDALEFKMRRLLSGFDPLVDTHRANAAVEQMLSLLARVPHSGLLSNDAFRLRQNQVIPRLARTFLIPEDHLRQRLTELRNKQSQFASRGKRHSSGPGDRDNLNPYRPQPAPHGSRTRTLGRPSEGFRGVDSSREDREPAAESERRLLRPGDLNPCERELLELVIVAPEIAPLALERVQSAWLESEAACSMMEAYQQLEFLGGSLEFSSVLSALEDPSLKSLLVVLHEQASAKLEFTKETAENRLRTLTQRMGEQRDLQRRQQQIAQFEQQELSPEEELDLLQDVIREARLRQGLAKSGSESSGPVAKDNAELSEFADEADSLDSTSAVDDFDPATFENDPLQTRPTSYPETSD